MNCASSAAQVRNVTTDLLYNSYVSTLSHFKGRFFFYLMTFEYCVWFVLIWYFGSTISHQQNPPLPSTTFINLKSRVSKFVDGGMTCADNVIEPILGLAASLNKPLYNMLICSYMTLALSLEVLNLPQNNCVCVPSSCYRCQNHKRE